MSSLLVVLQTLKALTSRVPHGYVYELYISHDLIDFSAQEMQIFMQAAGGMRVYYTNETDRAIIMHNLTTNKDYMEVIQL